MNNSLNCDECIDLTDMELPMPATTITNHTIEGVPAIEQAFTDAHEFVSRLIPEPDGMHGAIFGDDYYCVPCHARFDREAHPHECPQCRAAWDRPVGEL